MLGIRWSNVLTEFISETRHARKRDDDTDPERYAARRTILTAESRQAALSGALRLYKRVEVHNNVVKLHGPNENVVLRMIPKELKLLARMGLTRVDELLIGGEYPALNELELTGLSSIDLSECDSTSKNINRIIAANAETLTQLLHPSPVILEHIPVLHLSTLVLNYLPEDEKTFEKLSTLHLKQFAIEGLSHELLPEVLYDINAEEVKLSGEFLHFEVVNEAKVNKNKTLKRFELHVDDYIYVDEADFVRLLKHFAISFPSLEQIALYLEGNDAFANDDIMEELGATILEPIVKLEDAIRSTSVAYNVTVDCTTKFRVEDRFDVDTAAVPVGYAVVSQDDELEKTGVGERTVERRPEVGERNSFVSRIAINYVDAPEYSSDEYEDPYQDPYFDDYNYGYEGWYGDEDLDDGVDDLVDEFYHHYHD